MIPSTVRLVTSTEPEDLLPVLVELLRESVNGGASRWVHTPLTNPKARRNRRSLGPEHRGGLRQVFYA